MLIKKITYLLFLACTLSFAQIQFEQILPEGYIEVDFAGFSNSIIEYADFNNDGNIDFIITGGIQGVSTTRIKIYLGDGTGNFTELAGLPFAISSQARFALGDVDNDNDIDVVITTYLSNARLFRNDGAANFILDESTTFGGVLRRDVEFADVNNDNYLDMIISGYLHINDGFGNFSDPVPDTPFPFLYYDDNEFSDIDGDGDLDVVFSGRTSASGSLVTKLFTNDGLGNFSEIEDANLFSGSSGGGSSTTIFFDMDGDNDDDLLIKTRYGGQLYVNDGEGNFVSMSLPAVGSYTGTAAIGDVDNDDDLDLFYGNGRLYLNDGIGSFTLSENETSFLTPDAGDAVFQDIDNDNDIDLLISGDNETIQYFNDGNGNFSSTPLSLFTGSNFEGNVAKSDIDGDFDIDLVISSDYTTRVYRNSGVGQFEEIAASPLLNYHGYVDFVDIDNDNDADLMISSGNGTKMFINDGNGVFSEGSELPFSHIVGIFKFGDIDNDNDLDVFVTGSHVDDFSNLSTRIFKNDGAGNFTSVNFPFNGVNNGDAAFSDINGDGDLDLIISGYRQTSGFDYDTRLYNNDGDGNYSLNSTFPEYVEGTTVFADIDGDSDPDLLLTGGLYSGGILPARLYRNNGNGEFNEIATFLGLFRGMSDFEDIDLDGDLDLMFVGESVTGKVAKIYRNSGGGNFTEHTGSIPFEPTMEGDAIFLDLDMDDDSDVLIIGRSDEDGGVANLYRNARNNHIDQDYDGVLNSDDNCPSVYNPDQADDNNDGIGNVCDTDNDTVLNDDDNCPSVYNPDQADFDNDSLGDTCDDDIDNDGVLNINDNCNDTPTGDIVNVSGCSVFILPTDNFQLLITGETCRNSNNGSIVITATESLSYTAQLTGNSLDISNDFSNSLEFTNLEAGNYMICITIASQPDYEQCFNVTIIEPEDLSVLSRVDSETGRISLTLFGSIIYYIELNGIVTTTSQSDVVLNLTQGLNVLKVSTDKDCQGIYTETVKNFNAIKIYPNPVNGNILNINTSNTILDTIEVKLHSLVGQAILYKTFNWQNGAISIDMSKISQGVYILYVNDGSITKTFKVIKK